MVVIFILRSTLLQIVKISRFLFVCLFHGGVFRVPCMNFISCQSPVTSYQKSVKCRRLSHNIVLFISDALPLRTSTGDSFAGGLIWIIRRRRMRYLCSRCMEISGCDIAGDGIRRQLFAPLYSVHTHTLSNTHTHTHTHTHMHQINTIKLFKCVCVCVCVCVREREYLGFQREINKC